METVNLVMVCASAFVGVFLLLSFLALVMKAITAVFPQKSAGSDAAILAAVASTVSSAYPGTKITKIEEIK
ncbi:MAG: hypothetical protein V3W18_14070 [candidate division Zixibacteria bacterium]